MANGFRMVMLNGLLVLLYVGLGRLTFAASVEYGNVTSVVFLPEGVALAFSILYGPKVAPGVVLGQTLLSYWSGPSLLGGLGIGLVNASEAVLGGYLFRRWGLSCQLGRLRDVSLLGFMILFILQPISATGGVLILFLTGMISTDISNLLVEAWPLYGIQKPLESWSLVLPAWLHWWMGNSLGQLLAAPLLLVWLSPLKRRAVGLRWFEVAGLVGGIAAVLLVATSEFAAGALLLLTLSYALLAWVGLRCGVRTVTVANLLFSFLIMWLGITGAGFMSYLPVAERLFHASFFLATGVLFSLLLCASVEERRNLIQRLTELACKDALTQVSNRRHFIEEAERAIAAAQRHSTPVSLALLDLDHFKMVNDNHGHATGDQILRMFADSCTQSLRAVDLVGRVGGEEFALLLPHSNVHEARQAVQRVLDLVSQRTVRTPDDTEVSITFSAGVVESRPQSTLNTMYREADQALYEAKHAGRNRVHVHEG